MDKLRLLTDCPYDESIFIDADCIIYRDINFLVERHKIDYFHRIKAAPRKRLYERLL